MRVHVGGYSKGISRQDWITATEFFGGLLFKGEVASKVVIMINLTEYTNHLGSVTLPFVGQLPDVFKITINTRLSGKGQLTTLGHEMCHVEQIASGRFGKERKDGVIGIRWNRSFHKKSAIQDPFSPWENEAYAMEKKLFAKYAKAIRQGAIQCPYTLA